MKKIFISIAFTIAGFAQTATPAPASIALNNGSVLSCPAGVPSLVIYTGSVWQCVGLGGNITVINKSLSVVNATPLAWNVELVPVSTVASTATVLTYTTLKTPINNIVLYWYFSSNPVLNSSGAVAFTGNPINFTLPSGWSSTDLILFAYQ